MAVASKTLFSMILISSAVGEIRDMAFYNDVTKSDKVYRDSLFNISTSSLLKCTAKCQVRQECIAVSFTVDHLECRGYRQFQDPLPSLGTRVWKRDIKCPEHFTYTQALDLCWKWYTNRATYKDAMTNCLGESGRLLVIKSKFALDFFRDVIQGSGGYGYYWLGGTLFTGKWTWSDGTPVDMSSTFWGPGEPSRRVNGGADCIGWNINVGSHGKFDDGVCTDSTDYICEIP